jgi:hypothetical protein
VGGLSCLSPGCVFLHHHQQVYYLGYAGLKQVDLSDDQVVAAIATDDWENSMIPVEVGWWVPFLNRLGDGLTADVCVGLPWQLGQQSCPDTASLPSRQMHRRLAWSLASGAVGLTPLCATAHIRCTSQGPGEGGAIERLEMTREGFYQLVSLTSGEDFEAELIPQPEQQQQQKK